ncbi:MAG: hypothetical protein HWN65_16880 [Candidatus Helarchaeota archaeon]|nr:hypothetical protein [Candidatus Helarchaeota archaeon]
MIYELYIIDAKGGIPFVDKTYREIHLGTSNTLISGLLHIVYSAFDSEMEIGKLKSLTTQDYKLIYLKNQDYLFVTLADIKLEESKIQTMLNQVATSFLDQYGGMLAKWSGNLTEFYPFFPKMDEIVIETIAGLFFEGYPSNIVGLVDYIGQNYSLEYQELIGKSLARKILASRFSDVVKKRNLKKELSKFTVIKGLADESIVLSVCPFCRKKESPIPLCNFVSGFINGMLQSDEWVEKTCVSCGDEYCSFGRAS